MNPPNFSAANLKTLSEATSALTEGQYINYMLEYLFLKQFCKFFGRDGKFKFLRAGLELELQTAVFVNQCLYLSLIGAFECTARLHLLQDYLLHHVGQLICAILLDGSLYAGIVDLDNGYDVLAGV